MKDEPTGLQVYKFGGASVKDAAAIRNLCRIVREFRPGGPLLIVVSAMGKTTNALEEIFHAAEFPERAAQPYATLLRQVQQLHRQAARELFTTDLPAAEAELTALFDALKQQLANLPAQRRESSDQLYDQLVSFGELLATRLVARALGAIWLDCRPLLRTDHTWREGKIDWPATEHHLRATVPPLLRQGHVVTQGFVGGTADGFTTTLGREGSDYSAAILAYCLGAAEVTIWKDVPGLLNADPKLFADTVLYPEISYQETIEMAYYGASVIHPKTLKPLADRHIPLRVKSFLDPAAPGTLIHDCQHPPLAPAFIRKANQCLISFESIDFAFISEESLAVIFDALAKTRLKINLMQNSAISFSVCTDLSWSKVKSLLGLEQFRVHYNAGLTLFTIKNYDQASIERLTAGHELLLEQRTRSTFQFLVRE